MITQSGNTNPAPFCKLKTFVPVLSVSPRLGKAAGKEHMNAEMVSDAVPSPTGTDKIWVMLSHLSVLLGVGIILPLVVYLAMRKESEYVANNAREALNFHISIYIYALCCVPLVLIVIGVPLLFALGIASLVFAIIAAVKASDGQCYRYPLTLRLVR